MNFKDLKRYYKPNSLTWWASVVPLAVGVFQIAMPEYQPVTPFLDLVKGFYNDASPTTLINAGLVGIGVRGAM